MAVPSKCAKCGGAMEAGFVADRGDMDISQEAIWASGTPNRSFWRASVVQKGARSFSVATWRCERCGFLESYATEEFKRGASIFTG